jgi:hypothetical protein
MRVQVREEEEEAWEGEIHAGISHITFHPTTQSRRRFAFNSAQALMMGLHPEEAKARVGAGELPLCFSEADGLRYLIAEIGPLALPPLLTSLTRRSTDMVLLLLVSRSSLLDCCS